VKVLLSWSSGKDSAWALHVMRARGIEVVGLFSSVREGSERVAIHDVSPSLLRMQASAAGLPLTTVAIPDPCPNEVYERVMGEAMAAARDRGISHVAFGDLFLEDIRAYRESKLAGTGISPLFPLFGADTSMLRREMIDGDLRAMIVTSRVPGLCGKRFEEVAIPEGVDPCGENGEFHTFVCGGPMFTRAIEVEVGPIVRRGDYDHVDLQAAHSSSTKLTA
jgi:uncharacterized protein (TIGR00290 family)